MRALLVFPTTDRKFPGQPLDAAEYRVISSVAHTRSTEVSSRASDRQLGETARHRGGSEPRRTRPTADTRFTNGLRGSSEAAQQAARVDVDDSGQPAVAGEMYIVGGDQAWLFDVDQSVAQDVSA